MDSSTTEVDADEKDTITTSRQDRKRRRALQKSGRADYQKRTHGPHFETIQLEHQGHRQRIRLIVLPETPRELQDESWALSVERHNRAGYKIDVKINCPVDTHLDWLRREMRIGRLPAQIMLELFPNVKEMTESVAAACLLQHRVGLELPITVLDVGAGSSPRTGGILALKFPATTVHSIDPEMRANWIARDGIPNLEAHDCTAVDWVLDHAAEIFACERLAVVAVHSHAPLESYLPALVAIYGREKPLTLITMPCCEPLLQALTAQQQEELNMYMVFRTEDWGIHSEKRTMYVWSRPAAGEPAIACGA